MILETTPAPTASLDESEDDDRTSPMWMWVAGVLVLLALGLTVLGLAMSGDDPSAVVGTTGTILVDESSTSTSTSSPSTTTSTTAASLQTGITAARDDLEEVLSRPPRSNLNPPEVDDIMKAVDEAIEAAMEGDLEGAEKKLVETDRRLEEKLEDEKLDDARATLRHLADLLGVRINDDDDGDD